MSARFEFHLWGRHLLSKYHSKNSPEWNHSRIAYWRASAYISLKHARLSLERECILSCMWCAVFHFHRESSGDWLYHSLLVIEIHWNNKSILAFSCQSKQNLLPIQKKNSEYDQMTRNDVIWCQSYIIYIYIYNHLFKDLHGHKCAFYCLT